MTSFNVAGLLHEPPGVTRDVRLRDHYVTLGPDVELAGPVERLRSAFIAGIKHLPVRYQRKG